jgi:peptidoglycan lytic transglycosylase D
MQEARLWTLAIALCAAGCATAPRPLPAPQSPEVAELRSALESARLGALVVAPPPTADIDAAVSMAIPQHPAVRSALAYFTTGLKSDVQRSLTRSSQYRASIDRVLEDNKLPKALAYLPVIESAYSETMVSRAGARGMWQIMPETAREYGLRVDRWIDERADADLATKAAAAYLADLYRDFHDWPLALAAYNAGAARIHRALEETQSKTFWELLELQAIPKETRGYVPTFYATIIIAADPPAYGFRLSDPVQLSDVKRIDVEGPLSLKSVAKQAHMKEATLRDLNPVLRKGVVPRGTRVWLRVPSASAEKIAKVLRNNRPSDRILTGGM